MRVDVYVVCLCVCLVCLYECVSCVIFVYVFNVCV